MKNKINKYKNRIISISLLIIVSVIGIITVFTNDFDSSKVTDKLAIDNEYIQDDTIRAIKHQEYDYLNADKQLIAKGIVDASKIDNAKVKVLDDNTSVITFKSKKDAENYADKTNGVYFNDSITIQDAENETTSTEENSETNESSEVTYDSGNTTDNDNSSEKHSELLDYLQSQDYGKNDVTVAVIDSGITVDSNTKNVFNDRVLSGVNYSATKSAEKNGNEAIDDNGHGTSISYIIAQSTSDNVKLLPIKVIDSAGKGTLLSLYQGIKYAIEQNVDVINISLSTASTHSELIEEAIKEATDKGIIVVAAAGNYGSNVKYYTPAKLDNVITVASVNEQLQHSDFSNYGDAIDYATIGENVYTESYNGADNRNGTSYSAAKFSAIVSYFKAIDKSINTKELKNILNKYVLPSSIDKKYIGNGILSLESVSIDKNNHVEISENTVYKSILDYDNWKKLSNDKFTDIINNSGFKNTVIWWQNLSEEDKEYAKNNFTKLTENVETYDENHNKINKKYFELLDNYNLDSVNVESIPRAGYAYLGIYLNGKCDSYDTINTYTHKYKDYQKDDVWSPSGYYGKIDINCAHTAGGICGGISNLWAGVYKDSGSCFFYGGFSYGTPSQDSNAWLKKYNAVYLGRDDNGWWHQADGTATCDESVWQDSHATLKLNYATRHTIHYDGNGGNNPGIANQTKQWGSVLYLSSTTPTTPGYTFTGWNTKADGTGTTYQPGSAYGADAYGGTVTLYAQWKVSNKNITFNSNGGVWLNSRDDDIVQTYTCDSELKLGNSVGNGSYTVSRPGYKLLGWADMSHSNTKILNNSATYTFDDSYIKRLRISIASDGDYVEMLAYVEGADKVQFPTWSAGNWQDDLIWHDAWQQNGGWTRDGKYYNWGCVVYLHNHNKESTSYNTHVYAYKNNSKLAVACISDYWSPLVPVNGNIVMPTYDTNYTAIWAKKGSEQYFIGDKNSTVTVSYKPYNYSVKKNEAITTPKAFTASDGTKYYFQGYYYGNTQLIDAYGNFTQEGLNFTRFNSSNTSNATLKAKWGKSPYTPTKGTITYYGNGGKGSVPTTTVTFGYRQESKTVGVSSNSNLGFINEGHTFKCWNTLADGTGTSYYPGQPVTLYKDSYRNNITSLELYAQWDEVPDHSETGQYKVEFYQQDKNLTTYTKVDETQVYEMNYNQYNQGWYVPYTNYARNYTGFSLNASKSNFTNRNNNYNTYYFGISANTKTTIKVYFDRNKYKVTLTKDNGIASTSGAGSYYYGLPVTITASATKGYTFKNWNNNSSMTNPTYSFTMPPTNVSYTAVSNHTIYGLTVIPKKKATNGVEINATWNGNNNTQNFNMYYGDTKNIPKPVPNKAGYEFTHWTKTDSNTDSISKLQGTKYTQGLCNTTLTANFKPSNRNYKVNIYYENADDDGYTKEVSTTIGSTTDTTININANAYAKTGFTFKECRDANNKIISSLQQTVSADNSTTFNLYYTRNRLTVTYNANGGVINNQPYNNTTQNKYYIVSNSIIQNSNTTSNYKNVTTVIKYGQSNENILNPYDANISRRGYTFETSDVWKSDNGLYLSATKYQNTDTVSKINNLIKSNNSSIIVKLQWQAQVYHVTLNNQMDEQEDIINKGTSDLYEWYDNGWYSDANVSQKTTKITVPKWRGRTFLGYYSGKNGTGTKFTDEQGNIIVGNNWIADDTVVYANWSRNTYTFDVNMVLDDVRSNAGYADIKFNVYRAQYNTNDFKLVASNVSDYCTSWYYKDKLKVDMISSTKYTYKPTSKTWTIGDGNVDAVMYAVTKPIIHRVTTFQVNDNDFTVYAYVTSPGIIASVKFPAWTNEAGQDDICSPWYEGTKGSWTVNGQEYNYSYTIHSSKHVKTGTDEHNWYNIHTYAYDKFDGFNAKATTFNFRYNLKFNYNKPSNATSTINNSSETSRIIIYKNKLGTNNGNSKALPIPSMRGWTFNGWYTAASGGTKVDDNTIFTWHTATTIYAHWTANTYTITLDNQQADYAGTTVIYEKYDNGFYFDKNCTKVVSKIDKPKKQGNTFMRYYLPKNLSDKQGTQGNTIIAKNLTMAVKNNYFAEDITITAEWKETTYHIIFNGNRNTSGSTAAQEFKKSKPIILRTNGFGRTGWTYANKWNSATNGSRYTYNEASQLTWELFKREFTKEQLMSEEELKLNLYAQWTDTITPVISNVSIEQETLLSEVTKKKITLVSNKGFDGDLFTNISVKVNENNSGNDASGIREVHAYVYDKENKGNCKDYQLTIDNSKTVQTKYDFYYNGVKYPYSSTYKFKVNLYNEPQFRHSADLGIYIYAIDYQGNSSLTHETLKKLQNNNDKTIPEIDIPQSKPIIKDNPSNTKPPSDNNKPWDVIYHEVNECIYTTYLTAEGTNNFFAGELGIASVWTYGYVEHIDLDYDADTRYKINTEMETEIAENQLSEDNRMNRGYDIPNGINTLSTVWIQPVRIPPYVLQHLSTPSTTKQHSDGTTAYNDLLDIKYSSIGTKHSTKTDAYNSYNIQDAEYQDVHYRSGV